MSGETIVRLSTGLALVAANAFFVASEFALTRVRQHRKEEFEGSPALRRAWRMTERLEIHLTGCQVGITLTSILLGIVAEPAVTALLEPLAVAAGVGAGAVPVVSVVVAVVLINLVHTVYGEQVPTYLGVERPMFVAHWLAPALSWWTRLMSPLIRLGDWLAKASLRPFGVRITRSWTGPGVEREEEGTIGLAELTREMGELLSRGALEAERRREVLNALRIGSTRVREIMIPREEVVLLTLDRPVDENLARIGRTGFVRYPLAESEGGEIVGVVYVPGLFARLDELRGGATDLRQVAFEPLYVDADRSVSGVIDDLQDAGQEVALVREDGRVAGLVTITDAFEAIAGEVEDPFD